jgi:hypothetical protein
MTSFRDIQSDQWVNPKRRGFKMACCDCGLVHDVDFRISKTAQGNQIQMRMRRNRRSTAMIRRHNGITLREK